MLRESLTIYLHTGEKWNSWGTHSAFLKLFFSFWFFGKQKLLYIICKRTYPVLRSLERSCPLLTAHNHPKGTHIAIFKSPPTSLSHQSFHHKIAKGTNPPDSHEQVPDACTSMLYLLVSWVSSHQNKVFYWILNTKHLEKTPNSFQKCSCIGGGRNQCVPVLWEHCV